MRHLLLYIILFINIVVLYLYLIRPYNVELFSNAPLLIFNTEINIKDILILLNNFDISDNIKKILTNVKNVRFINKMPANNTNVLLFTDMLTYMFKHPDLKILSVFDNDEKVAFFIKPKDQLKSETLMNVMDSQLNIGYVNDIDRLFMQFLAISMGIDKEKVLKLLKQVVLPDEEINEDFFEQNNIHTLLLFTPLSNSNLIPNKFSETFKAEFIEYEGFDIDKLKMLIPYCKIKNIDMTLYFKSRFVSNFPIKTCIAFDTLLCGSYQIENDDDLGYELNTIIVKIGNFELINYYTMYANFFKQSMVYIDSMNKHIQVRDDLPILEQFKDDIETDNDKYISAHHIIDIDVQENLDGYYDSSQKTFTIKFKKFKGIPITLYSHINLYAQDREEENGKYIVHSEESEYFILKKYLIFDAYTIDDLGFISIEELTEIDGVNIDFIKEDDIIYVKPLKLFGKITPDRTALKTFESKIENPSDDSRYECYGQQQVKSRGLCESNYDSVGKPKKTKMYWDRRCEKNVDCPFYQANKNYKNYSGGCIDGFCQMPLGIQRVSYRKYNPDSKAICYNCKDNTDPYCCEDQKNKNKYPDLISPDYAFPLDSYERMKQLGEKTMKWFNY